MAYEGTIEMLRRGVLIEDAAEWRCHAARVGWIKETIAALAKAQRQMDERCMAAVDRVSEVEFERIFDEEQAKVCVFLDQLHAVRDHDRWPPHLYRGGV